MADEFVCSVPKESKLGFYRLHTKWLDDKVQINIASQDAAWKGEITKDGLLELAKPLKKDPEKYFEECKEALTTHEGKSDIVYSIDGNFHWKQIVDEDTGIKVKLGSIPIKPALFPEVIQGMMNVALDNNKHLKTELLKVKEECNEKDGNINKLFERLNDYGATRLAAENDFYKNFLAILNSKKKKISQLEQEILKLKSCPKPMKKPRKKKSDIVVNPYDEDTDEDIAGPSTKTTEKAEPRIEPMEIADNTDVDSAVLGKDKVHDRDVEMKSTSPKKNRTNKEVELSTVSEMATPSNNSKLIGSSNSSHKSETKLPSNPKDILDFFFGADD